MQQIKTSTVESYHSAVKMALHKDDPRGVVYVLADDHLGWWVMGGQTSPVTVALKALTIGELTCNHYLSVVEYLELEANHNTRLA